VPPVLTTAERSLMTGTFNKVAAAQASVPAGSRYIQVRSGRDSEWASVGVGAAALASGRASGVTSHVHEYEGPNGRGWELELRLLRDGVTWRKVMHSGPETWRERDWHVVPEVV